MVARLHGTGEPQDLNATLWRFMDFTRYVAMLREGGLFFTRSDQLSDPFEGLHENPHWPVVRHDDDHLHRVTLINCWHQREHESAAMWRIFLNADEGVAVRSTVDRLRLALSASPERLHVGKVHYFDDDDGDGHADADELEPFFSRPKSFDYERELRVLWRSEHESNAGGHWLPVDLEALVEEVVVAPGAGFWFEELVRSVTGKYGYVFPVDSSVLLEAPDPLALLRQHA